MSAPNPDKKVVANDERVPITGTTRMKRKIAHCGIRVKNYFSDALAQVSRANIDEQRIIYRVE